MRTEPERPDLTRRGLLWAAAGTSVTVAATTVTSGLQPANAWAVPGETEPEVLGSGRGSGRADHRFTVAVLPDTQYLIDEGGSDEEPVRAALRYLTRQRREEDIVFLAHLGDVTEHGTEREMRIADRVFDGIGERLPYSVLAGNHDVDGDTDDQRGDSPYLRTFGPERFAGMPTYGGSSPDGYNSYHVLDAGGRRWLLLALDWRVSDRGIRWAQRVLDQNPELPAILTTHDLVNSDERGEASLSEHGQRLWDRLIRGNDQIFLAIAGHNWPCGRTTLTNDAGNPVQLHLVNYQDQYYGGAGTVRLYTFDLARRMIDVETFSPWLLGESESERAPLEAETVEYTDDTHRFGIEIDFDARFAGFAPPALPPERPADAVVTRDTVAYWRFDREGFESFVDGEPVPEGAVARDLSGNGNDLVTERLHDSAADVLRCSAEHHEAQPAHASLRFDGGQQPDRGAVLRARPDAPINAMPFDAGYTIETFLMLPDPFEGDHAWMGILSWEGRVGEAGKDGGWSPDDAPCSLNLSSERFLQFVVYPRNRDDDPTCWSHALPTGRWTHVAVVNDGRYTTVYVDRSKIARNAAQRSNGITTLGKPFALGGTQSAARYGQGFYGWLGDTRISRRALRPDQFMTEVRSDRR